MRVLTIGTFDLLHTGHRHLFARAAEHGDLTVGVNTDRFVDAYKGRPPLEPEHVRLDKVANVDGVIRAVLNDGPGIDLIEDLRPELLVVGSDWSDRDYLGQIACSRERLEALGCDLLFVSRIPGFSTTALRGFTFAAVVVTHANPDGAARMLQNLREQSRPPDEVVLVATETSPEALEVLCDRFREVDVVEMVDEVGDWGHAKRARGLDVVTSDWLGFFNDDDRYEPDYLERMLAAAHGGPADVVYCAWNEQPSCDFALYHSTAGNFIVRRELAQRVGWPTEKLPGDAAHPDGYLNDGYFIERLKAAEAHVVRVDRLLYHHNAYEEAAA